MIQPRRRVQIVLLSWKNRAQLATATGHRYIYHWQTGAYAYFVSLVKYKTACKLTK